jgi:hypothetical protein
MLHYLDHGQAARSRGPSAVSASEIERLSEWLREMVAFAS